jgi:hypothetical protein
LAAGLWGAAAQQYALKLPLKLALYPHYLLVVTRVFTGIEAAQGPSSWLGPGRTVQPLRDTALSKSDPSIALWS